MTPNGSLKWILYSTCDEDANSELRALDIAADDSVFCVTGSGCRALSLLVRAPKELTALDSSPGQSYLLELKLAAIRALSYDDLLRFLGVDPGSDRWATYQKLEPHISQGAREYFRHFRSKIEKGVLFTGRHEVFYIRIVAPLARFLFGKALKKIFSATSLEEQRRVYQTEVNGPIWRWMIRSGVSEKTLRFIFNDPNYEIENDVGSVGGYLLERLDHTFMNQLAKDNDWLSLSFNGRYLDRNALPHFLLRDSYLKIRQAKTKVRVVTDDILTFVAGQSESSYSKFSLSDVTSCVNRDRFHELLRGIAKMGRHGGRVCYRNFLAKRPIPDNLKNVLHRDDSLCRALDWDDKAFAYRFEVATLLKN